MHDLNRIHIHPALAAVAVETDATGGQSEQRVVAADADVFPGEMLGAALANDDGASFDKLLVAALEAEAFAVAVAAVFRGTLSFFMCLGVSWVRR